MSGQTPGTGRFLNENGLVNEVFEDAGEVSFDLFEAADWPGGDEQGQAYAALITRAVNSHAGLVEALENIAQFQRDKCESAGAEMLFALLDMKVGIAIAALDAINGDGS